jgi:glucose dehydrogenase
MWGLTPIDQLICRILFKQSRYEGTLTPPSLQGTIFYPGFAGGSNWGSVSIDPQRGIMMAYAQHVANRTTLIPRDTPEAARLDATGPNGRTLISPSEASPQQGVPYAATNGAFVSFMGVPCQRPPYGTMTAIDLKTRTVLWEKPMGTTRNSGPFGTAIGLPLPMGVPVNGGTLVTQSGLSFYAGSQDGLIRAYNTETGDEVWTRELPVGSQATPMSYVSPASGKQFIVVTAGGAVGTTQQGDYVVAYTLK